MNQDITQAITQVLQKILSEDPNYFLPKQFHVLTWKSKKMEGALITKINGQRYLGTLKKDKTGQEYWSYRLLPNSEPNSSASSAQSNSAQTESKEPPAVEPSPKVKKFQAKYGTANEPKIDNSAKQ